MGKGCVVLPLLSKPKPANPSGSLGMAENGAPTSPAELITRSPSDGGERAVCALPAPLAASHPAAPRNIAHCSRTHPGEEAAHAVALAASPGTSGEALGPGVKSREE